MYFYEVELKQVSLSFTSWFILGLDPIVHSIIWNYAFQFRLLVNPVLDNILSSSLYFWLFHWVYLSIYIYIYINYMKMWGKSNINITSFKITDKYQYIRHIMQVIFWFLPNLRILDLWRFRRNRKITRIK